MSEELERKILEQLSRIESKVDIISREYRELDERLRRLEKT